MGGAGVVDRVQVNGARTTKYHNLGRQGSIAVGVWLQLQRAGLPVRPCGTAQDNDNDEASCAVEVGGGSMLE